MEEYKANQELSQAIQENRKLLRETLGKFFLDLAKIAFSTMVVGSIVSIITGQNPSASWCLAIVGVGTTCVLIFIGYKMIKLKGKVKIWHR